MNLGVLCPSEIALRRFMPALEKTGFNFVGVAVNSVIERYGKDFPSKQEMSKMVSRQINKANRFVEQYGGKIFFSFEEMIKSTEIDALYIPLPPGLHFKWAKRALEAGKHVLIEKPFTTSLVEAQELINIAREKRLALHENYMFIFHSQLDEIDSIINNGDLGEIRLYSIRFGFPMRDANDFRYIKKLGGGSLIDAGGYCIKYASRLLGESTRLVYSQMNSKDGFEVDMYGSGVLVNDKGTTVQIAFGMDNDYKCELEVWGSEGTLRTGRVLTAPVGYEPSVIISRNGIVDERKMGSDDAFEKSILHFKECILKAESRNRNYLDIEKQSILMNDFMKN